MSLTRLFVTLLLLLPIAARAEATDFAGFLSGVRTEALSRGISAQTLDVALAGVEPIPRIIELDRRQPEFSLTFDEYLRTRVTESRVEEGRRMLREHRALLDEIGQRFGVQPRFIVALWGMETSYGRVTGSFKVIPALLTLAYDGRRSAYFRKELMQALQIVDEGNIAADGMFGSWAGAMGQSQFMPSTFTSFAVDYDGDGRRNIWTSRADVFASAANYLARSGWRGDEIWGREVRIPATLDPALAEQKVEKTLAEWQALGVRRPGGADLPSPWTMTASLVMPAGPEGPSYLVYNNYQTILKWNRSTFFAIAVGTLADRIGDG